MPTQLLIYKSAVPVTKGRHGDCSVEIGGNYAFSGEANSVPLMAVEFPRAASEYAIIFAGPDDEIMPAAILGMRGKENLFLTDDDAWGARYIPAFVRRYPFVFSRQGNRFLLCVDEEFPGFNRESRGHRLFDDEGKTSEFTNRVLTFLQEYQSQFQRTQRFCARLNDLDLLEPMQAQVTVDSGQRLSLSGFMAVNRAKLKELPGDKLAELAKTDELELLYLHLQSMRNFEGLKDRIEHALSEKSEPEAESPPAADPMPAAADAAGASDGGAETLAVVH
jgi:hypothetical protein